MIAKALNQLTREEFEKLQIAGILRDIYPDAPSEYDGVVGLKPVMRTSKNVNVTMIRAACAVFMEIFDLNPLADDLNEYYEMLVKETLKAVYGDKVLEYITYTQQLHKEKYQGEDEEENS